MPDKARTVRLLCLVVAVAGGAAWATPVSAQTLTYVPVTAPIVIGTTPIAPPIISVPLPGVARHGRVHRSVERTRDRGHVVIK